jgi:hypothetical protein
MKPIYKLLTISYIILPLILIPFAASKAGSSYFLLGIALSYVGTWCVFTGFDIMIVIAFLGILYVWSTQGIHIYDYLTFYFCCLLGGYAITKMAVLSRKESRVTEAID